jgi:hypothetical protein
MGVQKNAILQDDGVEEIAILSNVARVVENTAPQDGGD